MTFNKEPPRAPKEAPKEHPELPRSTQELPRSPQEFPKTSQGAPKSSQGAPKSSQGAPKSPQGASRISQPMCIFPTETPKSSKGASKSPQGAPKKHPESSLELFPGAPPKTFSQRSCKVLKVICSRDSSNVTLQKQSCPSRKGRPVQLFGGGGLRAPCVLDYHKVIVRSLKKEQMMIKKQVV